MIFSDVHHGWADSASLGGFLDILKMNYWTAKYDREQSGSIGTMVIPIPVFDIRVLPEFLEDASLCDMQDASDPQLGFPAL